jgi:hypothetical protein
MQSTTCPRLAEDGEAQLTEAIAFLEAADLLACAALMHRTDPIEALEAIVVLQGRTGEFLGRVIVRAA